MTRPSCEDTFLIKYRDLKNQYYSLTFGPYSRAADCRPGQFVHIQLLAHHVYLRRAFSVASVEPDQGHIEILLRVFGRGSAALASLRRGDRVNVLGPLGTPFTLPRKSERCLLVAGGIGVPPLLFLATELVRRGYDPKQVEFIYGGQRAVDLVERSRIKKLGVILHAVTENGSLGTAGVVTDVVEKSLNIAGNGNRRIYACGPPGMLKATNELGLKYGVPGQLALEAPMPCGIGICLGCVVPLTAGGYARVCCDGPVFDIGEVVL